MGLEDVHLHASCRVSGLVLPPACAVGGNSRFILFFLKNLMIRTPTRTKFSIFAIVLYDNPTEIIFFAIH